MIPTDTASLPKPLRIVAWAFVFVGFLALVQTLHSLFREPMLNINFLVVFIFVGFGLLKRKPLWRSFAISCSLVVLILLCGNLLLVLFGTKSLQGLPTLSQIFFWAQTLLGIACSGYALWALQNSDVRRIFEKGQGG